ncbi:MULTISPECIES: RNA methyltransferase [unclassified Roseofilum]|uniref:TrmH family RNA methyltransferase n=1 Tax=unclassified Roseofilum TaxID=2620099 RepID=UPI000E995BAD|nr:MULTISPECIES: RNA methyltransferase [unclassified Roseofilum]MBP0010833.1 RNA methyltransferase [Roseofilum sp. Belize Diploria]MBP0035298.1 RNA methyltransferase [Roseofilum sp. Belize BBD 4]HBR00825.1 rRNA methyltransferase [Cyanobacteria bacterium UBA11691]
MLTSLQNPWVKQLRKLHQAKGRKIAQLCLLEGTHLVEAACQVNAALESAAYTPEWWQKNAQLGAQLQECCQRVEQVSAEVLKAIATTVNPDGVIATLRRDAPKSLSPRLHRLGLILETLQDPGNLGTILRTSAAVGLEAIALSQDSVDLDHPKVLRASAGAWFQVPMAIQPSLPDFIAQCRQQEMQIIATTANAPQSYWDINWTQPTWVVLGNEGAGLSSELLDLADRQVSIPIAEGVESLNVAISAALILYESQRQWTEKE